MMDYYFMMNGRQTAGHFKPDYPFACVGEFTTSCSEEAADTRCYAVCDRDNVVSIQCVEPVIEPRGVQQFHVAQLKLMLAFCEERQAQVDDCKGKHEESRTKVR